MPLADPSKLAAAEFVLIRHGQTAYNVERRVNGDPTRPVHLSGLGRAQAAALAPVVRTVDWGSAWHTRFPRTRETLDLLLGNGPPRQVIPELDDIDVGELEGQTIEVWRAWRRGRGLEEAPPGGESRIAVLQRYARGFERLVGEAALPAIVVCHDQAIRYLENVLADDDPLFGAVQEIPNATPYAYTRADIALGAERLVARASA
jgi:2,3-bisphosphoglycerate-dependent phosphoglycerate mutase